MQTIINELLGLEGARHRALVERDFAVLEKLFADDVLYVHSTGVVQDKAVYLDYVRGPMKFQSIERNGLQVKVLGDVAIMTGNMTNTILPPGPAAPVIVEAHVTQIWQRSSGGWQISLFQATRLPVPAQQK